MLRFKSEKRARAFVDFWKVHKPALEMTRAGRTVAVAGCDPVQSESVWAVMIEEVERRQPDVFVVPPVRDYGHGLGGQTRDPRTNGNRPLSPRWYPASWPFYEPAEFQRRWLAQDWQRA